jgi:DnaJ homolog subfamily B member 12
MLEKSLRIHALPGVGDLLSHAKSKLNGSDDDNGRSSTTDTESTANRSSTRSNGSSSSFRRQSSAPSSSSTSRPSVTERQQSGLDGRAYSKEQVDIIRKILSAKKTGRGAHYKVLELASDQATENDIKKAYRKLSLKVHPDKNSAPGADEAFKAVGLAYATLSDPQKRAIYDRYGDEDPDNVGGGMAGGGMRRRHGGGQEMSPEEIFNAFFGGVGHGGGMGMGPGFHVYSTGFGPGMHFAGGMPRNRQQQQRGQQNQRQDDASLNFNMLMQLLPLILIILVSFFNSASVDTATQRSMPGENQYFSLTVC